jgi:hypothetical protein
VAMLSACRRSHLGVQASGGRKEWHNDHQRKTAAEILRPSG